MTGARQRAIDAATLDGAGYHARRAFQAAEWATERRVFVRTRRSMVRANLLDYNHEATADSLDEVTHV